MNIRRLYVLVAVIGIVHIGISSAIVFEEKLGEDKVVRLQKDSSQVGRKDDSPQRLLFHSSRCPTPGPFPRR